jgi:lipase maturation factor 1
LLPACEYLHGRSQPVTILEAPTIFWIDCSDATLRDTALVGAVLSLGLICTVAPLYCLLALWALYLSFVNIGQDFLSFQWDNLLLEAAFFSLFITPAGLRPKHVWSPHPIAVFLMLWLVLRLHVESGAAKLLTGDPTWRNLTAMVQYYETAPLPTWVGWYAHQMPVWAHQACALFTFVVELGLPLFIWAPHRIRTAVFWGMIAMQVSVILTANYGFFNYLTMALCLFVLDDGHLQWVAQRFGRSLWWLPPRPSSTRQAILLALVTAVMLPVSVVPFLPFVPYPRSLNPVIVPVRRALNTLRSVNAYHLFASMTLVRREVVLEGSDDGSVWSAYEFRYKPGDPDRAPPFVAPHQPRVDFQLWFLLLNGAPRAQYFNVLLLRLLEAPPVMAPLFSRDPFPEKPPAFVRAVFYRYTFTDSATRRTTGNWWQREWLGFSKPLSKASFSR